MATAASARTCGSPAPRTNGRPPRPVRRAHEKLLDSEVYEGCARWMHVLIEHCDDAAMYTRPLHYFALDHRWEYVRAVTILGDTTHPCRRSWARRPT